MSFSAFRTLLPPTGVDHCTTAFLTHCPEDRRAVSEPPAAHPTALTPDIGTWAAASEVDAEGRLLPNLVVVKANMLEVYVVRASPSGTGEAGKAAEGSVQGAWLELAFESRLEGIVVSLAVLKSRQDDLTGRRTKHDALILGFRDAKLSVLEWDDDEQTLQTSSLHCFESATWHHLKRGLERFPRGPVVRAEPQGRCAVALLYDDQLLVMKPKASGLGFGEEETAVATGGAASVEETYFLDLRTVGVKNVKDLVFLHGYLEPALLVLHEPDPTWGGRASVRRFSCEATVLSLNTTLRQHPSIFAAQSLPYDAYQAVAVAAPLGGALIVAANTVHYFSQTAFQTLALNSFAAVPEGVAPSPSSSVEVELDVGRITWLARDTALVSAKTGMLYTLTLTHDGRVVHSLDLSPSKGAVLASSVCTVGDSLFFLGSRLGDSMLVKYSRGSPQEGSAEEAELEEVSRGEPPAKRARLADVTAPAADISDEMSLYGRSILEPEDTDSKKSFTFSICDTMLNIGPVRDLVIGKRTKTDPDDEEKGPVTETELVLCSGHAKNGALSVLHQGIRPTITTEVDLGGACRGIWAVHDQTDGSDAPEAFHSYVVISLEDGTRVLSTGESIAELDEESAGFFTSGPTLAVGNLFGRDRILQVHAEGFYLLEGAVLRQEVPLFEFPSLQQPEVELRIAAATICDPFVLFQLTDGSLRIGESDSSEKEVMVGTVALAGDVADGVTAVTLFEDTQERFSERQGESQTAGESSVAVCAAVARRSGAVEFYSLPDFELVYRVAHFSQGARVLVSQSLPVVSLTSSSAEALVSSLVVRLPNKSAERESSQPYIVATLSSGAVLAHRGFFSGQHALHANQTSAHTPLQERTANGAEQRSANAAADNGKPLEAQQSKPRLRWVRVGLDGVTASDDGSSEEATVVPSLTSFEGVSGRRGVYLSASRPAWVMECGGRLRPHVQLQDGPVAAFSPFHNVHNPHGCVYVTASGVLRIAQLPTEFDYDAGWPVAKVPVRATPHQVAHFAKADVYVVAVSVPLDRPFSRPPGTPPQEDPTAEDGDGTGARSRPVDSGAVFCDLENFELRMLAPGSWDTVSRVPMLRYEHIAAATAVALKNVTNEQRDVFLAVGTVSVLGEDASTHGRVLLYRVEKSQEENSLESVFSEEHRAGVTSVAAVQGCLVAAIGTKVILYRWDGTGLVTAAFFDAPMYVTSLTSLKSYVLVGDFERSIHFVHWVDTPAVAQLRELAKDYARASTATTAFMNDGKALALVAADYDKNLRVFEYSPSNGQLTCRAEVHVGSLVAKLLRVDVAVSESARGPRRPRSACVFGTLDGSLAALMPLDEMTFKRLQALHRRMSDTRSHTAGLNPRACRKVQDASSARGPVPENAMDLDLAAEFGMLRHDEQAILARQIGTSREKLLADLGDLWRALTLFS